MDLRTLEGTIHAVSLEATGAGLRKRRRDMGLSQAVLAEHAGVSRQDVIRIEKGEPGVRWEKVHRVLRALQVSLPRIVVYEEAPL